MQTKTIKLKHTSTAVTIRPAMPYDAYALLDMHGRLSNDTLYSRYLRSYTPDYEELLELCQLPADQGAAFVVVTEFPWETIIGFGYYLIDPVQYPVTAEPAVLIEDRFQGQGLGSALMNHLAQHARRNHIKVFDVVVHQANKPMLHILPRIGPVIRRAAAYGSIEMSVQLEVTLPSLPIMSRNLATAV